MYRWLVVTLLTTVSGQFVFKAGPLIPASTGEVWPLPQSVKDLDEKYYTILPSLFQFKVVGNSCKILRDALDRYRNIILVNSRKIKTFYYPIKLCSFGSDPNYVGYLTSFEVALTTRCNDNDYPFFGMDEEYQLTVSGSVRRLTANTIWGILRGLESFSQLIYITEDYSCHRVNTVEIQDYPRFLHRGLLLDTARHYYPEEKILRLIDAMSWNKFNVFHWHITDDYSSPYVSTTFPDLSGKGAFQPTVMVYEQSFVREVIEYARLRGIRVMVEFDTPGHTLSWGLGYPYLLTQCFDLPQLEWGPLDPTRNTTFDFVFRLYDEIKSVFKDKYVHLGGDEVDFTCWESNPAVNQWMAENSIADYPALQNYYTQRLIKYATSIDLESVVWEEVFTNSDNLDPNTVVNVWISDLHDPKDTIRDVTAAGYRVIQSAYWYLDKLTNGGDWLKFYNEDPQDFDGTAEQKNLVIGAEACMWSEVVDETNMEPRVWPRASVAAERFWSASSPPLSVSNFSTLVPVAARLQEQACRLHRRGINAQPPSGPSVCF